MESPSLVRSLLLLLLAFLLPPRALAAGATEVVVATVDNGHMIELQRLTPHFERANPDIRIRWVMLEESVLRQRVASNVVRRGAEFDVVTIGMYETQVWGQRSLLRPFEPSRAYDVEDLLPAMRAGVSVGGKLHAAPFYGESSFLMYRTDLAAKANIVVPARPTWAQVRDMAARLHDPANGVYGICLRGKPGWGDNMALILTMVNGYGGQWFSMDWLPQVDTPPWQEAVSLYVDLVRRYGPPGSAANSYNELLSLFSEGRCALWVDATIAASFVDRPETSKVAGRVGYAQAPYGVTTKGANWLWAWTLGIPAGSRHPAAAKRFIEWATSKEYVALVAARRGWGAVPTGTRQSTYDNPEFLKAAPFATAERRAIDSVNPGDSTLPRSPYQGVQYAAIPEFQTIGTAVGVQIAEALKGRITVKEALRASQHAADQEMRRGGYY